MSNLYLKLSKLKSKLRFSKFKTFFSWSVFCELQVTQISVIFQTSCRNIKIRDLGVKLYPAFLLLFFSQKNYDLLKSKDPCFLSIKNINFHKNETDSRMENPLHSLREMNHVLHVVWELQIPMSWNSRKKKQCIFHNIYFVRRKLF